MPSASIGPRSTSVVPLPVPRVTRDTREAPLAAGWHYEPTKIYYPTT